MMPRLTPLLGANKMTDAEGNTRQRALSAILACVVLCPPADLFACVVRACYTTTASAHRVTSRIRAVRASSMAWHGRKGTLHNNLSVALVNVC